MPDKDIVNVKSLGEGVYRELKDNIINGVYPDGFHLVETKLCDEFNVSRTPIREAIAQLEIDGLAQTLPNRVTVVVAITKKDIEDIYDIRIRLEGLAARLAAINMTAADIKELEEVMDIEDYHTGKNNIEKVVLSDSRFHDCIYRGSKSKILIQTFSLFKENIKRARNSSLSVNGRAQEALSEHKAIFMAIKNKDCDKAEELAVTHIKNAKESILITFKEVWHDEEEK